MILSRQSIVRMARGRNPGIRSEMPFDDGQFQPSSLDLRLKQNVYCMRVSGLPKRGETMRDLIERHSRYSFELTRDKPFVIEQRVWHLIEIAESLSLPKIYSAEVSPKSSTGRGWVFTRVLGNMSHYDRIEEGYQGPLYLEVFPMPWPIKVVAGLPLTQIRFRHKGNGCLLDRELMDLHAEHGLVFSKKGKPVPLSEVLIRNNRLYLHLDLQRKIVGWVTKASVIQELEMHRKEHHRIDDFLEPIYGPRDDLVVSPGRMYLFATEERVRIPKTHCGQLDHRTIEASEARQHIAGFFDPNFGEEQGKHAVLEYIPDANFGPERLVHGQIMSSMLFEQMAELPDKGYGRESSSHYAGDTEPQLPKFFKDWNTAWE